MPVKEQMKRQRFAGGFYRDEIDKKRHGSGTDPDSVSETQCVPEWMN